MRTVHPDFMRQQAADHLRMLAQEAHHTRRVRRLLRNPIPRTAPLS